ncbi:MAG: hypothetical protein IPM56_01665 [Ignavibacteriales bacterium]|nr:MAG: hypothetical protein IPM56_01665 [Ignavibacteriales bacterium]
MFRSKNKSRKSFDEVEAIYRAHSSFLMMVGGVVAVVTLVFLIGGYFTYSNINETMDDVRLKTKKFEDNIRDSMNYHVDVVRRNVVQQIEKEFDSKNIRELIEEVARYKVQQYGDKRITEMIDSILTPKIELTNLELLKLAAQNDSRRSLDELRKLSSNYSYSFRTDAKRYFDEVINEYNNPIYPTYLQLNSEDDIDLYKMNVEELSKLYSSVGKVSRQLIIYHVKSLKDLPSKTKREFFISKLKIEKSIEISIRLSSILIQELNLSLKPTEWDRVLNYGKN